MYRKRYSSNYQQLNIRYTSYGPSGPRGESGAKIFGGSPNDPGMPVTHEDIINGIKQPSGETFPPAIQIK